MSHAQLFLPQPPRAKGNADQATRELLDWLWKFFQALAIDNKIVIESNAYELHDDFSFDDLPEPTDHDETTIATAQHTANAAWLLGVATRDSIRTGGATVSGASASVVVAFSSALPDASYRIALTPIGATGAPAAGSDAISLIAKTATGFTLTVKAAPGPGNSVSFDFIVIR